MGLFFFQSVVGEFLEKGQLLGSSKLKVTKELFFLFCYPADREPHPKVWPRVGFSLHCSRADLPKGLQSHSSQRVGILCSPTLYNGLFNSNA